MQRAGVAVTVCTENETLVKYGRTVAAIASLSMTACLFGTTAGSFAPAAGAPGVHVAGRTSEAALQGEMIWAKKTPFEGELLAVNETALVVLAERPQSGSRIWVLPYRLIEKADFDQMGGGTRIRDGVRPPADQREKLRLVSRFPAGVPPELLERLRSAYTSPLSTN